MTTVDVLTIRLTGTVDEKTLDVLCAELQMEPQGRLDDDWDDEFGLRFLRPDGEASAWLGLYRESDTEWDVEVSAEPPFPAAAEIAELRGQVFAAAEKVNLTATQMFLRDGLPGMGDDAAP